MTIIQKRRFYPFMIPAAVLWLAAETAFIAGFANEQFWLIPVLTGLGLGYGFFGSAMVLALPLVAFDELTLYVGRHEYPLADIERISIRKRATRYGSVDQWYIDFKAGMPMSNSAPTEGRNFELLTHTGKTKALQLSYKAEKEFAGKAGSLGVPIQRM